MVFPPIQPAVETHHLTTSSQFQEAVIDRCLQLGESCTNWWPNNQLLADRSLDPYTLYHGSSWRPKKAWFNKIHRVAYSPKYGKTLWTETAWNKPVCSKINYCNSNRIEMEEFLVQSTFIKRLYIKRLYIKRLSFSSQPASLSLSAVGGVSMRGKLFSTSSPWTSPQTTERNRCVSHGHAGKYSLKLICIWQTMPCWPHNIHHHTSTQKNCLSLISRPCWASILDRKKTCLLVFEIPGWVFQSWRP